MAKTVENWFNERLSKLEIAKLEAIGKEVSDSKKINKKVVKQIAAVTKSENKPDMDRFMQLKSSLKHNGRKGEA